MPVIVAGAKLKPQKMVMKHTQRGNKGLTLLSCSAASAADTICQVVHAHRVSMISQPESVSAWVISGARSGRYAAATQNTLEIDTTGTVSAPPISWMKASTGEGPS